jgi:predicted permease
VATFAQAFAGTAAALLQVFVVVVAAGILVRVGVIRQRDISALSDLSVTVFLPCLIFSNVLANLEPGAMPMWWVIPLSAVAMPAVGLALGALAFMRELPAKRNLLPLASMQNAGYLVLPVGLVLFPDRFDTFALYCFLFILGFNPVLWSVGKLLTTSGGRSTTGWKGLLTPPLLANVAAVAMVLAGADGLIRGPVLGAVELVGKAAVPVATLVLGAVLGSVSLRWRANLWDGLRTIVVKLVALPALTIAVLIMLDLGSSNPLLARFFVVEAAAAPAAGLILQVRTYGGDESKIGTLMVLSYLACAVALPAWVAAWELVAG